MAHVPEGVLLGVGSLLLDLHATVDKAFLDKWDLKENDAIMCDDRQVKLFHELMEKYDVEYVPGGAGHNVMHVCQPVKQAKRVRINLEEDRKLVFESSARGVFLSHTDRNSLLAELPAVASPLALVPVVDPEITKILKGRDKGLLAALSDQELKGMHSCALTSLQLSEWILNVPFRTVFFGSIGRDPLGELLVEKARAGGIDVQYQVHDSLPTGRCAVLVNGEHRSLCSNPAAASSFVFEHVQLPGYQRAIHKAQYYYIVGFFLNVCPATVMHIAEHSHEHKKTFSLNLSAPYVCQKFPDFLLKLLPYVDILFGNEAEAVAFANAARFETTDLREIVTKIATFEKRSDKVRLVVITRGEWPIMVAEGGRIEEIAIYPTEKEKIVDTNGAGDAFVGGFLSQYIQGLGVRLSVECGNYAAAEVIQRHGCTVPEKCRYH